MIRLARYVLVKSGHDVAVRILGEGIAAMTERMLHDSRMSNDAEQIRRGGVAQVMDAIAAH